MPAPLILIDASPRNAADGTVVPFRVAGGGGDLPYPQGYRGGIVQLPKFVASLDFDEDSFGTGGVATASVIEWAASVSDLAAAAGLVWEDAAVTVRIGPEGGQPPIALQGKVMKASAGDGRLQIAFADPAVGLKKSFLRDRFEGTGGLEGPVDWTGTIKRRVFGRVWNLPGSPIDPANNIYCFADPLRQINAFAAVRDKGAVTQQLDQLAWQGTPEATLAALQAADAPEGGGIACPPIACVKWWTQPAGELTADLTGETAGGYVESTAGIVSRVVSAAGGPAFAAGTLDAAYAARPAPVGLVVENEGTTASQILDQLLGNVSLLWVLAPTGEIVLREWEWGPSTRRVKAYSIGRSRTFRPLAARRTGYRLNQLPMARNTLAAIVLVKDLEIPPEQFLNSERQWRDILDDDGTRPEDNATVGAPAGTPVNDRPAEEVTDKLDEHDAAFEAQGVFNANQIDLNTEISNEIDAAQADITGLFNIYGDTAAASVSTQIAENAKNTVEGYVGEVEQDRLAIEGFKTTAVNASTTAVAARDGAKAAESGASVQKELAAKASRQAINGAQTFGRSPGSAIDTWAVNQFNDFAATPNAGASSIQIVDGIARVPNIHLHPSLPVPIDPNKSYKSIATVRTVEEGALDGVYLYTTYWDENKNLLGGNTRLMASRPAPSIAEGAVTISAEWKPVHMTSLFDTARYARVMVQPPAGGVMEVREAYIEDIDGIKQAEASAAAAATSFTAAESKATESGNYALAAQQDRISAQAAALETSSRAKALGLVPNGDFSNGTNLWTVANYTPESAPDYGYYLKGIRNGHSEAFGDSIPVTPGRTYKVKARWVVHQIDQSAIMGFKCYNSAGQHLGNVLAPHVNGQLFAHSQFHTQENIYSGMTLTGASPANPQYVVGNSFFVGTASVRPIFSGNYPNFGPAVDALHFLLEVQVDDVTESQNAATEAQIATDAKVVATNAAAAAEQQALLSATLANGGVNLIANSALSTTAGWSPSHAVGASYIDMTLNAGGADYHPVGENALSMIQGGPAGAGSYMEWISARFSVKPNSTIQAWVYAAAHRTSCEAYIGWCDSAGNIQAYTPIGTGGAIDTTNSNPDHWVRLGSKTILVPGYAISAVMVLRKNDTLADQDSSYGWFWRPYVAAVKSGLTEWNNFSHGTGKAEADALHASVTENRGAITTMEGAVAFLRLIATATGSNPAMFEMLAGKNGSRIGLVSDQIALGNGIDGIIETALSVQNGQVVMNDSIIRRLRVAPTAISQIVHEVALRPIRKLAAHGQTVQYQNGASYGQNPIVDINVGAAGLPALAQNESYDVRAINIGPAQCQLRAVKYTAAGTAVQDTGPGSNVGGTPQWQVGKASAPNAKDGQYQFSGQVTLNRTASFVDVNDSNPSNYQYTRISTYSGQIVFYGYLGGAWQSLGERTISRQVSSPGSAAHPSNDSFAFSEIVNTSADFGTGPGRFGVHSGSGIITGFSGVTYTTQTASNEQVVAGNFEVIIHPPTE